jgi:hypothetical protein
MTANEWSRSAAGTQPRRTSRGAEEMPSRKLGFAVKVVGEWGLPSHDTRRWQSEPHLRIRAPARDPRLPRAGADRHVSPALRARALRDPSRSASVPRTARGVRGGARRGGWTSSRTSTPPRRSWPSGSAPSTSFSGSACAGTSSSRPTRSTSSPRSRGREPSWSPPRPSPVGGLAIPTTTCGGRTPPSWRRSTNAGGSRRCGPSLCASMTRATTTASSHAPAGSLWAVVSAADARRHRSAATAGPALALARELRARPQAPRGRLARR